MKDILSATNAAKEIGVSVRQFWRIAKALEIQPVFIGSRHYAFYTREQVERIKSVRKGGSD